MTTVFYVPKEAGARAVGGLSPSSPLLLAVGLLLGMLCLPAAARAQGAEQAADTSQARQVEIVRSDSLVQVTEDGERVRKLIGNVRLRQGTTLLSADRATQYRQRDEILFTGDVLIIDEGDSLWADRVRYDSRRKVSRATGNVRVADGEVLLAGPTGRYFFDEKRAVFPENVTLVDSARVLKSRAGEYFSREERAEFYRQVRVFSDSTYLEADSVTYHRSTEVSEARGAVFIERRGDRADSGRGGVGEREPEERQDANREEVARAVPPQLDTTARASRPSLLGRPLPVDTTRRALLPDTTARTLLWGTFAHNDPRSGYSRVTGRALLVRLQPPDSADSAAPPDTFIVRARQLETARSDTLRRLTATDSVRLWQKDLQAVADSAVYDQWPARRDTSTVSEERARRRESRFFGTPFSWSAAAAGNADVSPSDTSSRAVGAQLSGDSLRVTGRGGAVRRLYSRGDAFLARPDSALDGRFQQLKGRRITGRFTRDSTGETTLRSLSAGPNAEMIHYQKKDDGTLNRATRASSDTIVFRMRAGELEKIRVLYGVEATSYKAANVPEPFRLDGFVWVPGRRPRKEAFLTEERVRRRLGRPEATERAREERPPPGGEEPSGPPAKPPPTTAASSSDGS